eukprot:237852-Chlamydomonas_euryale.AAC.1
MHSGGSANTPATQTVTEETCTCRECGVWGVGCEAGSSCTAEAAHIRPRPERLKLAPSTGSAKPPAACTVTEEMRVPMGRVESVTGGWRDRPAGGAGAGVGCCARVLSVGCVGEGARRGCGKGS